MQSQEIARAFAEVLGLPDSSGDGKARVLGQMSHEDVIIEDVRIPSERETEVPCSVVRPATASGPLPAVVCLHGTSNTRANLTAEGFDLSGSPKLGWARELARRGFLTAALDQRGGRGRGADVYVDSFVEQLAGRPYMGRLVCDVLRCVDYLASRADVASGQIGCTGFSLGGIVTAYSAVVEPRIAAAAPVCGGIGRFRELLAVPDSVRFHSTYFYPPGLLTRFPHDQPQILAAIAPRPLLVIGGTTDRGMPLEGVRAMETELSETYERHGAGDAFRVSVYETAHDFDHRMFDELADWFGSWLAQPTPESASAI